MKIPFDIKYRPQIESGEYKVETRNGSPVRIICWDATDDRPIIVLMHSVTNTEEVVTLQFYTNGRFSSDGAGTVYDLFVVTPEEELTDFEQEVSDIVEYCKKNGKIVADGYAKRHAKSLLSLAREQFIKDGYVIEKKAFYDAVKKVDPKVMKEVSESIDNAERTEFERELVNFFNEWNAILPDKDGVYNKRDCEEFLHKSANKLLTLAEKELSAKYKISSDLNGFAYGKGYEDGKKEALKDLPRWKKIGQGNNYSSEAEFCINGRYLEMNDTLNDVYEIFLKNLEKLPKEDEE